MEFVIAIKVVFVLLAFINLVLILSFLIKVPSYLRDISFYLSEILEKLDK